MPALLLHVLCSGRHYLANVILDVPSEVCMITSATMGSLSFHGVVVAALPGTSQLLTQCPSYLSRSSACAASAAEAAARLKEKKNIESTCNHHFFPIAIEMFGLINHARRCGVCGLHFCTAWAIESLLTLTTHERHFSLFNAFPLRSSALMPSVSPIRSAILRWKCDVTSRDTPSSCFFIHNF